MAHYLFQGGYAPEAWAGLIENPEDRTAVVRAALESIGGQLDALYYTFGTDDFVGLAAVPDHIRAEYAGLAERARADVRRGLRDTGVPDVAEPAPPTP